MSYIKGTSVFVRPPPKHLTNHFEPLKMLALYERKHYLPGIWYARYLSLA